MVTAISALTVVSCYACGVDYAIPKILDDAALERRGPNGKNIWCPNGHSWHYIGETEADKERRLRKWAEDSAASARARADQAEASLRTTKGVVTKLRKRAITGTCAFCKRHFANVERHVATVHPTEASEPPA